MTLKVSVKIKNDWNFATHDSHPPCSFLSVTIFNKDIIDCDTLLLTVSSTPIWHPLEKWFAVGHGHKTKSAQASESRVATEKPIGREIAAAEIAM